MTKKFLKLMAISIFLLPITCFARTITCTTSNNYKEGVDVYKSASVSCKENGAKVGTIEPFAICEVGSSIYDAEVGASSNSYENSQNSLGAHEIHMKIHFAK